MRAGPRRGRRYLDIRAARLDDNEIIATWRDVTDRVEAEEALADSEALLRGAFDDAPVGALLISLDGSDAESGRLLKVNRAFAGLVGYRQNELLGMPLRRLFHPDDLVTAASPRTCWNAPVSRSGCARPTGPACGSASPAARWHSRIGPPTT